MLPINRVIFRRLGIAVGTWCLREIGCAEYDFCGLFFGRPATTVPHTSPHSSVTLSYCDTGIKNNTRTHVKSTKRFFIQTFFGGTSMTERFGWLQSIAKVRQSSLIGCTKASFMMLCLGRAYALLLPFTTLSLPFSPFLWNSSAARLSEVALRNRHLAASAPYRHIS